MYNYPSTLNASFDIRGPDASYPRSDLGGYPGGGPMTDRWSNPSGINRQFMENTNVSVKATVRTRTRDQRQINQHQLAFIYTKDYDRPVLLSLVQLNQILAGGDPMTKSVQDRTFFNHGTRGTVASKLDNPMKWTKEYIKEHFKLFGAVVNRDVDTDMTSQTERIGRTFTVCVRGDCHVLDYWSHKGNKLRRYDQCYFVLKKVWLDEKTTFQNSLTARLHGTGSNMIGKPGYYWQVFPYNVKDSAISPEAYTTNVKHTKKRANGDKVTSIVPCVGSYWRVGYTHEYATIDPMPVYDKRHEHSVARDVSYLVDNGAVRPMQFYLHFDDDTKLI